MEEIIGLLVVVAVAIFKAVGKKLENAGTKPDEKFEPVQEESMPEAPFFGPRPITVEQTPVAPKPVMPKPVMPKPAAPRVNPSTIEVVTRQTAPKKPILEEPEQDGPKEKIDTKKLVLYSEIMKPKFNE